MQVKKAGGKVYGAVLTAAEKKAMDLEIQRELAEYDRKHIAEIDATILWVLLPEANVEVKVDLSATPTAELVDQLSRAVQIPKHALRGGRV